MSKGMNKTMGKRTWRQWWSWTKVEVDEYAYRHAQVGKISSVFLISGASTLLWNPPMSPNAALDGEGVDVGVEESSPKLATSEVVAANSSIVAMDMSPLSVMSNTLYLKLNCFGVAEGPRGMFLGLQMDGVVKVARLRAWRRARWRWAKHRSRRWRWMWRRPMQRWPRQRSWSIQNNTMLGHLYRMSFKQGVDGSWDLNIITS